MLKKIIIFSLILSNILINKNPNIHKPLSKANFIFNQPNIFNNVKKIENNKENKTINIFLINSNTSANLTLYNNFKIFIKNKSNNTNNGRIIKDVIFIVGSDMKIMNQHFRYRVLHQMEQLNAGFLESDIFFYENLDPLIIINYRIIIFFGCPWIENIEKIILLAKNLNKKVLFDIDELIINLKYESMLPFYKNLSTNQKELYDDQGIKTLKTLKMCDGAITTTKALAKILKNYVSNVFINHNVPNDEMWKLSENALIKKNNKNNNNNKQIIIGYFSWSITHNPDLEIIKPSLVRILRNYRNVKLLLFVKPPIPKFLKEFSSQIICIKYVDWKKLPKIISNIDINIAPIKKNIFNEAKSENNWVEAAMVKIPTVASNYGEFKHVIIHNETGFLCSDNREWYKSLKTLIKNEDLRKTIGENAYNVCKYNYNSIYTGTNLVHFINSFANKHIGFFLPSLKICGGIYVILKHACILKDNGWDVDLIVPEFKIDLFEFQNHFFNIISLNNVKMNVQYDIIVATFYRTLYDILKNYKTKKHIYLVQGYETDFYRFGSFYRIIAEKTYSVPFGVEYITISKWCEKWLWKKYRKKSRYAPNGIDLDHFKHHKRELKKKKIRILIEGSSSIFYKNVDESFKIIEKLDKNKFEIWYMSYLGKPKDWYQIDKFFYGISYDQVNQIYEKCDILLKSSLLESFSYPPLEMMATGGYCIVVPNEGNKEYLIDGQNCLFYKSGDIDSAINNIKRLIMDEKLQNYLYENGLKTAKNRDWKNLKKEILDLYDF